MVSIITLKEQWYGKYLNKENQESIYDTNRANGIFSFELWPTDKIIRIDGQWLEKSSPKNSAAYLELNPKNSHFTHNGRTFRIIE